jgi:putative membrane-bound dehydrogenase-like protein
MRLTAFAAFAVLFSGLHFALAQVPHGQDKPPGPALSPQEAIKKMTVPPGFTVELVASEPDIVNPVAMTIDDKGRFWITESLEYPRREPGKGRDRIKVLEDTDGDGKCDKVTIFAEGLNIPSGIAVGHGGVWVANAPDILFMQDTNGDLKADKTEVVVTGFGRDDTHELPNSLTWGPDGWLYGLNGVFNHSHVEYRGKTFDFTCALFRIHPKTRDFELFCEGTSNPWGVAFDTDGSAFISACVIDHLWHLVETGYYHRQGGPYPPFTWKIESIVKHKHQKAAYCGITYFDSDAYPVEYRGRLYMGNIHGGCINVDEIARDGATYAGSPNNDFLTANDAWFMPVVQKTGPDGCLYVLDWYDRYHCYQDANRDPAGIDRLKGRLYRVRYKDTPRAKPFDYSKETDGQLLSRLGDPNVFVRDRAQLILSERVIASDAATATLVPKVLKLALDANAPAQQRRHAMFVAAASNALNEEQYKSLLGSSEPWVRAWGVRIAGNQHRLNENTRATLTKLANDPSPEVRLQVAIASNKVEGLDAPNLLLQVLAVSGDDTLIPKIVWQNLLPHLNKDASRVVSLASKQELSATKGVILLLPRMVERVLAEAKPDANLLSTLVSLLVEGGDDCRDAAEKCFDTLASKMQTGELSKEEGQRVRDSLAVVVELVRGRGKNDPLYAPATLVAAMGMEDDSLLEVVDWASDAKQPEKVRSGALRVLISRGVKDAGGLAVKILADKASPKTLRQEVMRLLTNSGDASIGAALAAAYEAQEADMRPQLIELLTSRAPWSVSLIEAVKAGKIPSSVVNSNQVRKMLQAKNEKLTSLVTEVWGSVRLERDPARDEIMVAARKTIRAAKGDPHKGVAVYKKVCGQCHKMYGEGQEVGPDITLNGRSSFEQLLSNVFDPSRTIGASYQARTVVTTDGRVISGLLAEDNDRRVVLKVQGGKQEIIPRSDIDELSISQLSLMPEGLEKQLTAEELVDLFAYITLDRPPTDPEARLIPGAAPIKPRESEDKKDYADMVAEVLPGFELNGSGYKGVALLADHRGQSPVLRTHPLDQNKPSILSKRVAVPKGVKTTLRLPVGIQDKNDWRLRVLADKEVIYDGVIGPNTTENGWLELTIDLTPFAGKEVLLSMQADKANEWWGEFAFWGVAQIVSE